jgi:hypothetical protein
LNERHASHAGLIYFCSARGELRINSIPIPLIGGFRPSLSGLGFGLELLGVTRADTLTGLSISPLAMVAIHEMPGKPGLA